MTSLRPTPVALPRRDPGQLTPPEGYARLRATPGLAQTMLPGGFKVWLVTRHEDARAVLTDARISSDPARPGFPNTGGAPAAVPGWFVAMDAPAHSRFRKLLIPEFTIRRIKELRPVIERIVGDRVDAMLAAGNSAELVSALALPLPSLVICQLLGVPYADHDFFESRTRVLVDLASTKTQRDAAFGEIQRYIVELTTVKRTNPGDDLISRLLANGDLSGPELCGVAMLLLVAGHETTANMLSLGVVTLLNDPQWIGDTRTVEELLRYFSISDLVTLRVAVEDLEISGQQVLAGDGIGVLGLAANHDGGAFERPDEFDPSRPARHHVAFGYGMHQCIGQHLARIEMEITYKILFDRVPGLRLAVPMERLPFKHNGVLFGLHALPVRW